MSGVSEGLVVRLVICLAFELPTSLSSMSATSLIRLLYTYVVRWLSRVKIGLDDGLCVSERLFMAPGGWWGLRWRGWYRRRRGVCGGLVWRP